MPALAPAINGAVPARARPCHVQLAAIALPATDPPHRLGCARFSVWAARHRPALRFSALSFASRPPGADFTDRLLRGAASVKARRRATASEPNSPHRMLPMHSRWLMTLLQADSTAP